MKNTLLFVTVIFVSLNLFAQDGASSGTVVSSTPTCAPCDLATLNKNYKRTHLIMGSLESTSNKSTVKNGGTSTEVETTVTELNASYYYNFGRFALGGKLINSIEKSETSTQTDEIKSSQVNFGGRYFFIENVAVNNLVPYVGLELMGMSAEDNDTPKFEMSMGGSQILVGLDIYLNQMAFLNFEFGFGAASGEAKQGSTTLDTEVKGGGLSIGIGVALE